MKLQMILVALLAAAMTANAADRYHGSFDPGGCQASAVRDENSRLISWTCPNPIPTDDGLGGPGAGGLK